MSLIVISGTARSGKDTLADYIIKKMPQYVKIAYADALKEQIMEEFDLTYNQLYGDLKEVPDVRYKKQSGGFWTPREMMQFIGTDTYRSIDDLHWINKLFDRINAGGYKNVIVTDGRFLNEITAIKDKGGYHVRIQRNQSVFVNNSSHSSETALDNFRTADYNIYNDGDINDLKKHVDSIINIIGYR